MLNEVHLIGNLGADPESRTTQSGMVVARLRVATTHRRKKGDAWEDETAWHRVSCFGRTAENVCKFLAKGRQVYIKGRISYGSYEKDGVTRYTTDIIANDVKFLGSGGGGGGGGGNPARSNKPATDDGWDSGGTPDGYPDEDIPF